MPLLSSADFFKNYLFQKIISVSNGLDQDQNRHSVGHDLGTNCLQRLSADDKSAIANRVNPIYCLH